MDGEFDPFLFHTGTSGPSSWPRLGLLVLASGAAVLWSALLAWSAFH